MFVGLAKSTLLCFIIVINLICVFWVRDPLCEPNFLCISVLRITSGPSGGGGFVDSKRLLNPPVVYATDRSKAVIMVLFWFCVGLWFSLPGVSCWVLLCSLFSCVCVCVCVCVLSCLALWSSRLGTRKLVYVLLMYLFVYFSRVNCCPFSLPLGVRGWLRLVTETLSGRFY